MTVLDASTVLAYLRKEPGWEDAEQAMAGGAISAVNWSEVLHKARAHGVPAGPLREAAEAFDLAIVPFDAAMAEAAAEFALRHPKAGLSLGDRACLALGQSLGATILTADRRWKTLGLGSSVRFLR
jgi:ribonuclease VapC